MSQGGRSERVSFLRAHIAQLDAAARRTGRGAGQGRVALGAGGCGLHRSLGGGLGRAALHEVVATAPGDAASAAGFTLALAARCAAAHPGAILWVGEVQACREAGLPYAPGLRLAGLDVARLVFVRARTAQDALWALEEALKSRACAAVVGELWTLKAYDLTASRRLVLAAQAGATPCLLLAAGLAGRAAQLSTGAATRFEVRAAPSAWLAAAAAGSLPLPGAAAWSVRLAKARAGPDGADIDRDRFHPVTWDHAEGLFHDALPRHLAAHAGHRPDVPPAAAQTIVRLVAPGHARRA